MSVTITKEEYDNLTRKTDLENIIFIVNVWKPSNYTVSIENRLQMILYFSTKPELAKICCDLYSSVKKNSCNIDIYDKFMIDICQTKI